MPKLSSPGQGLATSYEDLGGPSPENYSPTNDSAKLQRKPKIKTVADVVNKGAKGQLIQCLKWQRKKQKQKKSKLFLKKKSLQKKLLRKGVDIEEDVNALLGGEELSEEFKKKQKLSLKARLNLKNQRNPGNPWKSSMNQNWMKQELPSRKTLQTELTLLGVCL